MAPPARTDEELARAKAIGERIRELRRSRKMSATKLAGKADMTADHLFALERGEHVAFERTLRRLARALGVKLHDLTGEAS